MGHDLKGDHNLKWFKGLMHSVEPIAPFVERDRLGNLERIITVKNFKDFVPEQLANCFLMSDLSMHGQKVA